jgi:rhodanese-related sulfurtransferase
MARKIKMSSVLRRLGEQKVVLIDVLDPESYDMIHLKGAINIPVEILEDEIRERVDPGTPVITYGIDYECPISKMAAEKLEEIGYRDVSYYAGGKKEWLEAQMPVEKKGVNPG